MSTKVYAFEGINASGKSTLIEGLSKHYSSLGKNVKVSKIGGLGENMPLLKKILGSRVELQRKGLLTEKQEDDFKKDRIFRIAIRRQLIYHLMERKEENVDIYFLDRTPIMSWAYTASVDRSNPYLSEILEEGVNLSERLSIDTLFYVAVNPVTVYTRMICRSCDAGKDYTSQIKERMVFIDAPKDVLEEISEQCLTTLTAGAKIKKKSVRSWDFMPYNEVCAQVDTYREGVEMLAERLGTKVITVDGNNTYEKVFVSITGEIR